MFAAVSSLAFSLFTVGVIAGLMIGCIGIGGVIIVPILSLACGVPVGTAAAAAMMGYIVTGLAGTFVFGRTGSIDRPLALLLCSGAIPGALSGAWIVLKANPYVIQVVIAVLAGAAGLHNLRGRRGALSNRPLMSLGPIAAPAIGCIIGLASALTGTGGPLVLVPLLMWLGFPVLGAIGLGQTIQLPIAITATGTALALGSLEYSIAITLCLGLVVGCPLGAWISHHISEETLRLTAATVLIGTSAIMGITLALR